MPALSNHRQERFAQEMARGQSATDAMEAAGYADPRNSTRLTKNDEIRTRIAELQERAAIRTEVTIESLTEMLLSDRKLARENGQLGPAVAAVEKIGKLHGFFIDRKEVGEPGAFANMTLEQKRDRAVGLAKKLGIDNIGAVIGTA